MSLPRCRLLARREGPDGQTSPLIRSLEGLDPIVVDRDAPMYAVFLRRVVAGGLVVRATVVPDYDIALAPDVMVLGVGYHHAFAQLCDQLVAFLVLDPDEVANLARIEIE